MNPKTNLKTYITIMIFQQVAKQQPVSCMLRKIIPKNEPSHNNSIDTHG